MLPREHYLKQSFADSVHFPNGFEKGGLSDIQARLVRKNGTLISALCIDEVSDPTSEDLHILKVIANQSSPKNPVEQAWVKYLNVVKNLAAANPKGKSKTKTKLAPALEAEPVKPVEKAIEMPAKPAKIAEKTTEKPAGKTPTTKPAAKASTKKTEPARAEVTAKLAAKKEKVEPVAAKVPAKAAAKKAEPVKAETKKAAPKKAAPPKATTTSAAKVEHKKPAAKKATKSK